MLVTSMTDFLGGVGLSSEQFSDEAQGLRLQLAHHLYLGSVRFRRCQENWVAAIGTGTKLPEYGYIPTNMVSELWEFSLSSLFATRKT